MRTLWFNSPCKKGEIVSTLIDAEWHKQAFEGAPTDGGLWFGEIFSTNTGRELIPLRCFGLDYWLLFVCPIQEAGSSEMLEEHIAVWANGFQPLEASRVIKFCRADAEENHFTPDKWRLPRAEDAFWFFQLLGRAIAEHADSLPDIKQYFFFAASQALANVYVKRVFRYIDKSCLPGIFVPILDALGEFHGYQRP